MTRISTTRIPEGNSEPKHIDKLVRAAANPRDQAFISLLARDDLPISEIIQLEVTGVDFKRGTLSIVHSKERLRLKCTNCGEILSKRYIFCPGCGNKVEQAIRERIERRRHRLISVNADTLRLLDEYLKWRRKFPYRGPLVFPFSRQRGWQIVQKLGRRVGIPGLHPRSLRQLKSEYENQWETKENEKVEY